MQADTMGLATLITLVGGALTLVWAILLLASVRDAARHTQRTALAAERLVALLEWHAQQQPRSRG